MYSYDDISLFVKVVDAGSFIGAAKQLKIGQATISRRMQALEKQLGIVLFKTNNKGFELSHDGHSVYSNFKNKSTEFDSLINKLIKYHNSPHGIIKVSLPPVLALELITPYLPGFLRKYPDITLEICYQNRSIDLIKDGFDIAILNHIPQQQSQKIKLVYTAELYLYCTKKYKETYGVPLTPEEGQNHLVVGHMLDDYSVPNKINITNKITGEILTLDSPKRISINSALHSRKILYSNKVIVGLLNDIDLNKNTDLIQVLPDYRMSTINYYILKHQNENRLINIIFSEFLEELLSKK